MKNNNICPYDGMHSDERPYINKCSDERLECLICWNIIPNLIETGEWLDFEKDWISKGNNKEAKKLREYVHNHKKYESICAYNALKKLNLLPEIENKEMTKHEFINFTKEKTEQKWDDHKKMREEFEQKLKEELP